MASQLYFVGASVATVIASCGVSNMVVKSFLMVVIATLMGPAVGIGLFVLVSSM